MADFAGSPDSADLTMSKISLENFKKGENWKAYAQQLNSFIAFNEVPEEKQKSLLITQLSTPVYEILCNLCAPDLPQDPQFSFVDLVEKLEDYFQSKDKYVAHLEYERNKQGLEKTVKKYKFEEHITDGVKSEAMCLKVFRAEGSVKDLIKIATEVEWEKTTETYQKRSSLNNDKTGMFAVSSHYRRSQQGIRKKIVGKQGQKNYLENPKQSELSTKFCYCCGKNNQLLKNVYFLRNCFVKRGYRYVPVNYIKVRSKQFIISFFVFRNFQSKVNIITVKINYSKIISYFLKLRVQEKVLHKNFEFMVSLKITKS